MCLRPKWKLCGLWWPRQHLLSIQSVIPWGSYSCRPGTLGPLWLSLLLPIYQWPPHTDLIGWYDLYALGCRDWVQGDRVCRSSRGCHEHQHKPYQSKCIRLRCMRCICQALGYSYWQSRADICWPWVRYQCRTVLPGWSGFWHRIRWCYVPAVRYTSRPWGQHLCCKCLRTQSVRCRILLAISPILLCWRCMPRTCISITS